MTEQYALQFAALRARRLKWPDFDHQPRSVTVPAGQTVEIESNDALHLLLDAQPGISIEGSGGFYDPANGRAGEQSEEFTGRIRVRNRATVQRQVRFLQVIPRKS